MHIRRFSETDADSVCAVIERNLREVNSKDYPAEYIEANIQSHNRAVILDRAKDAHMYVACEGDTVLGCGAIAGYYGSREESILLTIFVLPELHGRGIGQAIVHALENDDYFRRAKRIEIPASITACDFYRKLGYDYKGGVKRVDEGGCIRLEKYNHPR